METMGFGKKIILFKQRLDLEVLCMGRQQELNRTGKALEQVSDKWKILRGSGAYRWSGR